MDRRRGRLLDRCRPPRSSWPIQLSGWALGCVYGWLRLTRLQSAAQGLHLRARADQSRAASQSCFDPTVENDAPVRSGAGEPAVDSPGLVQTTSRPQNSSTSPASIQRNGKSTPAGGDPANKRAPGPCVLERCDLVCVLCTNPWLQIFFFRAVTKLAHESCSENVRVVPQQMTWSRACWRRFVRAWFQRVFRNWALLD